MHSASKQLISISAEAPPKQTAVLRYVTTLIVILAMRFLVPEDAFSDSRGIIVFLVIIACSWYTGAGPGMTALVLLIISFKYRTTDFPECLFLSQSEAKTTLVLAVVVGSAGNLRRRSLALTRQQAAELRELHQRKDQFLATLAHELRNPLAPLRNGLEVLRISAGCSAGQVDLAAVHVMMRRQLEHLVRLIDDLLDISRINTGKIELRFESIPLADVIRDAVETSNPHITAAGHELSISMAEQSITIQADRARLSQVLTNLLNNAAKFTPTGGRIALSATDKRHYVEIAVCDTGIGISTGNLPKIFEMFAQASNPLTRTHGGLGIGLSLARSMVEMHGGTLTAYSEGLGKGSKFVLTLPNAASPEQDKAASEKLA